MSNKLAKDDTLKEIQTLLANKYSDIDQVKAKYVKNTDLSSTKTEILSQIDAIVKDLNAQKARIDNLVKNTGGGY